jgi:M6 family metalloprotease-like protein
LLSNALQTVESNTLPNRENAGDIYTLTFIVFGPNGEMGGTLWPHMNILPDNYSLKINGETLSRYMVLSDMTLSMEYSFMANDPCRVACHEMGHILGALDLEGMVGGMQPVGPWDLMGSGFGHMTSYIKERFGKWIGPIPVITNNGRYTLLPTTAVMTSTVPNCYRINSPHSSEEYFMVEYRKNTGPIEGVFLNGMPHNSGLIIYRVNERGYYPVNNFHVYVLRKNDSQSYTDLQNAALNQSNQAAGSNPEFRIHLADGRAAGIDISNFVIDPQNETISFTVGFFQPASGVQLSGLFSPGGRANAVLTYPGSAPLYPPDAAYQWQHANNSAGPWEDITGAALSSYTFAAGDSNKYFRVIVEGGAGDIQGGSIMSAPIHCDPVFINAVRIFNRPAQVVVLMAGVAYSGPVTDPQVTYQWQRMLNGEFKSIPVNIPGATTSTYILTPKDAGSSIRVAVSGTGVNVQTGTVYSSFIICNNTTLPCITDVTIKGSVKEGEKLESFVTYSELIKKPIVEYQWLYYTKGNIGRPIPGAVSETYVVQAAYAGMTIQLAVRGTGVNVDPSAVLSNQLNETLVRVL